MNLVTNLITKTIAQSALVLIEGELFKRKDRPDQFDFPSRDYLPYFSVNGDIDRYKSVLSVIATKKQLPMP